ncbi:oxidoreductase [Arthrobacter sp. Y-9]|uniref:FAD-dependent oxidoreductase n=1 Tax=Arthrobacter sp. Y-9 TaxID=3039385 RepID=UPI00241F2C00|nr:oxidoreductase [Arthrobacter sp. Y-9]WFR83035.1 oxidoreductase [Arthrobacter sp. Y-9]
MSALLSVTQRVTRPLGRLSMTRVVALSLGVLIVYSLVLDALGWTEFGVPELCLHLVLCLAATALSNGACALLFRMRPYWDSSLVTAGLLYFLFWPATGFREGLGVALAAVLASASKYALAWHGRHLFNPAALGAFIISLTGLNAATWWVGSPLLLWAVVPLGLLVLYRAGQFPVALTFLAASLVTAVAVALGRGMSAAEVPALWFTSQATVFFACFMLSEPLTLPPRRWQRILVGVLVGVLFSLPFSLQLGTVILSNAPEAVLLVGNILAFILRPKSSSLVTFLDHRPVGKDITEFTFRAADDPRLAAGQYVELTIPVPGIGSSRRVFSPVAAGDGVLRIATRMPSQPSPAKKALYEMETGTALRLSRTGGEFLLGPSDRPALLVAGGIGITPFVGMLDGASAGSLPDTVVLYSVRDYDDAAYLGALARSGAKVLLRTSTPLPEGTRLPDGVEHVGSERFSAARIAELVPDAAGRHALVSGAPDFVAALRGALRAAGVRRVKSDSFLGY